MIFSLLNEMISIQREIYLAFGERIKLYAEAGDWSQLAVFLPMGILFGAVHAMTPGHSKTLLAAYVAATPGSIWQALGTAFLLSAVHVSMSVVIVLLSLPLFSAVLGSAGQAPLLEDLSRGLLGFIGVWMIWSAVRRQHAHAAAGRHGAFAVFAGLIPCPLTLFVMTFAVTRGVTEAGLAFAAVMLLGVAVVLGAVAVTATLVRKGFSAFVGPRRKALEITAMLFQTATGLLLVFVAVNELMTR